MITAPLKVLHAQPFFEACPRLLFAAIDNDNKRVLTFISSPTGMWATLWCHLFTNNPPAYHFTHYFPSTIPRRYPA